MGSSGKSTRRCRSAVGNLCSALVVLVCAGGADAAGQVGRLPVFPAPVAAEATGGALAVDARTAVVVPAGDEGLRWAAGLLSEELGQALGAREGRLDIVAEKTLGAHGSERHIMLGTTENGRLAREAAGDLVKRLAEKRGAYVLRVGPAGVAIYGRDAAGAFYGALTLLQFFTPSEAGKGEVLQMSVADCPYHFYRGMRSTLPRGKPREGEISHAYYRDLLRLMAFCRLNHVWVQGCSWCVPMRRHPECSWADGLTIEQAREIAAFAARHFLSMDGSLDWQWVYYGHKHLAELRDGETWEAMTKAVRKASRVNVCPSNPATWQMLFETMEDQMDVLAGDHYAVSVDEMYQEYHGSRWAACVRCKGRDPVELWAAMASRLCGKVLERGKVPILGGGMLMREHQGWYKGIHQAIDRVARREEIVVYNWSEGHIRRGAMRVNGVRLQVPDFRATPFFRSHGYKDVVHLFAGSRWQGRPEMREVRGKLDCYGGFVSYYHAMDYELMKQKGTLARLAFTAQHLWSPDVPAMDSRDDERACRYAEAMAEAILRGRSYVEAIGQARRVWAAPKDTLVLESGALGRSFESKDPQVNLLGNARGDRTEGFMRVVLPVEEANPASAYLVLTLNDWDQRGEGEITLNGHRVALPTSRLSNGRDYRFPPVAVPVEWLKFGPEPNVLRFVYTATAGFIVRKAQILIADAPAK